MLMLHDQSVAESIKIVNDLKNYASEQEQNALAIAKQVIEASPRVRSEWQQWQTRKSSMPFHKL